MMNARFFMILFHAHFVSRRTASCTAGLSVTVTLFNRVSCVTSRNAPWSLAAEQSFCEVDKSIYSQQCRSSAKFAVQARVSKNKNVLILKLRDLTRSKSGSIGLGSVHYHYRCQTWMKTQRELSSADERAITSEIMLKRSSKSTHKP